MGPDKGQVNWKKNSGLGQMSIYRESKTGLSPASRTLGFNKTVPCNVSKKKAVPMRVARFRFDIGRSVK